MICVKGSIGEVSACALFMYRLAKTASAECKAAATRIDAATCVRRPNASQNTSPNHPRIGFVCRLRTGRSVHVRARLVPRPPQTERRISKTSGSKHATLLERMGWAAREGGRGRGRCERSGGAGGGGGRLEMKW